jgi:hypothetical protein
MAQGDPFVDCDNKLGIDSLIRLLIYKDANGNPVLHTDSAGTSLLPFFECDSITRISLEQIFRSMILIDANGNPYLNTTTS